MFVATRPKNACGLHFHAERQYWLLERDNAEDQRRCLWQHGRKLHVGHFSHLEPWELHVIYQKWIKRRLTLMFVATRSKTIGGSWFHVESQY